MAALTTEELKALEYQAAFKRREAFQRMLQGKLVAPNGPRQALQEKMNPLRRSY